MEIRSNLAVGFLLFPSLACAINGDCRTPPPEYSHGDVMTSTRDALLKLALPLVKNHGFTRNALSLAAMYSPSGKHAAPLNDMAVDALFGEGDEARRTLINAWLEDARVSLRAFHAQRSALGTTTQNPSLGGVLKMRLSKNEDVLEHLPEVSGGGPNSTGNIYVANAGIPMRAGICPPRYATVTVFSHLPSDS